MRKPEPAFIPPPRPPKETVNIFFDFIYVYGLACGSLVPLLMIALNAGELLGLQILARLPPTIPGRASRATGRKRHDQIGL